MSDDPHHHLCRYRAFAIEWRRRGLSRDRRDEKKQGD
jgi:hypothetical protein